MGHDIGRILIEDFFGMQYANKNNQIISISSEYISNIKKHFNVKKDEVKDLRNLSGPERERLRRNYNGRTINKYFYSITFVKWRTVVMVMGHGKVQYVCQVVRNGARILVTKWYHERADKMFL